MKMPKLSSREELPLESCPHDDCKMVTRGNGARVSHMQWHQREERDQKLKIEELKKTRIKRA